MARVMGLSGYGCQLNRSMQHFNQVIRQYPPQDNRSVRLYSIKP